MVDNKCVHRRSSGRCVAQYNTLRFGATSFLLVRDIKHMPASRETQNKPRIFQSWSNIVPTKITVYICTTLAAHRQRKPAPAPDLSQNKRGLCRVNQHRPQIHKPAASAVRLLAASISFQRTYRTSRMSSKYIVPAPPAAGLPFVPKPIVMVLTLVRSTPANSPRSMIH